MEDSKDYFVARIVTNEEMKCNGYMDFLCRNMKEQITNGILAIVSDGNEYAIRMLPEQRIKKPDMLSVEIRQGLSVKELVRCGECKHGTIMKNYLGDEMVQCGCEKNPIGRWNDYERWLMPKGFYCADGERKEQDDATN